MALDLIFDLSRCYSGSALFFFFVASLRAGHPSVKL